MGTQRPPFSQSTPEYNPRLTPVVKAVAISLRDTTHGALDGCDAPKVNNAERRTDQPISSIVGSYSC
jgi:hypothetical protein